MTQKKKQYYVVVHGRRPGVYNKWFGADGAAEQVEGFAEAIYKGFYAREEALEWLREFSEESLSSLAPDLLEVIGSSQSQQDSESPKDVLTSGRVLIYTDGGVIGNPGPGGYGVVLRYKDHKKELSGGFRLTTNNRMEIWACIEALRVLKHKCSVVIYSDSKYVVEAISRGWAQRWQSNGWKKSDQLKAENTDLWEQLLHLCTQHEVSFRWIRGHIGTEDNERCDQLAMEAARRKDLPSDFGYENKAGNDP
jgi:ribonuclease HI